MQDFKRMHAWQRAYALSIHVDKLTRSFHRAGQAYLRSQLRRAVASISTNIAEGCGAATKKEFARYLDVAIKSANEAEHHLLSARDRSLISLSVWQACNGETIEIRRMIYSYRKKLLESDGDDT